MTEKKLQLLQTETKLRRKEEAQTGSVHGAEIYSVHSVCL